MKYSVKVRKVVENGKPLKATCSVTIDEQFNVHGIKRSSRMKRVVSWLCLLDHTGTTKEVLSLIDYICGMEKTLTEMPGEMQAIRQEINPIHNNTLRVKCQNLVDEYVA